jgi:hypothetical protein
MKIRTLACLASLLVLFSLATTNVVTKVVAQKPTVAAPSGNVSFSFDGMEALFFGASDRVSVGVLNAHNHRPKITVTKVVGSERTVIAQLTGAQLSKPIFIDAEGLAATGVSRHLAEVKENDPFDARWMIDFNELYPQEKLTVDETKLFTKVHISSGLFYSDKLSKTKARFFAADGSQKTLKVNRKMAYPAAKLNLANGDKLIISGGNFEPIRLVGAANVSYQVDITNLPPKNAMSMDHFLHYYEVVDQPLEKYVPVWAFKAAFDPLPVVCAPLYFSAVSISKP